VRLRAQPPVHSPLSLSALTGGFAAALSRGTASRARAQVLYALREDYDARAVLLADSGTSALALALRAAVKARPGPVALPAFSCYDIATAADAARVPFVLYDLNPTTLAPDLDSLNGALRLGAGAVVIVHLFGVPVDLTPVAERASGASAILVEDAAQAAGAAIGGRPAGAYGQLAVLSFGRGKGTTGGRGGALLVHDASLSDPVTALESELGDAAGSAAGGLIVQWLLARPSLYAVPLSLPFLRLGETVYRVPARPRRMARFGLGVLARTQVLAAAEAEIRRAHAGRLLDAAASIPGVRVYVAPPGAQPGYLRFPLLLPADAVAAGRTFENRRLGIWPSYPRSLADLPGFGERRLNREDDFPGARTLAERLVTLPVHSQLQPRDIAALERWIARLSQRKEP
jgi:dTDP-4-amino-4,6-dideoxygalactose transaminase